jgi:predicted rRNA methylase YqxC with S4 and FtsJ domains
VIDASFISLALVLPATLRLLRGRRAKWWR